MPHTRPTPQRVQATRFLGRVRLGLLSLFTVLVVSDVALLWMPPPGQATSVNVAGRQRMLSQRIARFAEALASDPYGDGRAATQQELRGAAQRMVDDHRRLLRGYAAWGLEPTAPPLREELYDGEQGLALAVEAYTEMAEGLASLTPEQLVLSPLPMTITAAADPLMVRLDEATQRHEAHGVEAGRAALWLALGLSAVEALLVLLVWGLGFRPMMKMLRKESEQLDAWEQRNRQESAEQAFAASLARALDMANAETEVLEVASRALAEVDHDRPSEMLLADHSRAHLKVGAVDAAHGRAGCPAQTPFDCPSMRQGQTLVFRSSEALDACPHLRGRGRACSATCTPVTFMGQALGVLHQLGDDDAVLSDQQLERLQTLAAQVGTRLGTVQSFARVEQQAQTDPLTGLLNRRALEDHMRRLAVKGESFSVAVADLDHFKNLNDTYGHDAGDRALRTFAKVAKANCRPADLVCRWGGEEFVFVWPGANAAVAESSLQRLRKELERVNAGQPEHPSFTGSYGVSDSGQAAEWREVITLADAALLQAKENGRDRVLRWSHTMEVDSDEAPDRSVPASKPSLGPIEALDEEAA